MPNPVPQLQQAIAVARMGDRVSALRARLKLSQAAFGERVGVTNITVHRWENGKAAPSPLATTLIEFMEGTIDCCPLCFQKLRVK